MKAGSADRPALRDLRLYHAPLDSYSRIRRHSQPAARLLGASPAAPLGGIRQHEQIQTGEQEQDAEARVSSSE
jgi:hypothetical protein